MRPAPAVALLALGGLLAAAAPAAADPGPLHAGDRPVDRALASVADDVDDDGCVVSYGECRPGATKWAAVVAASAGVDPASWPSPNASVAGWIADHAGDLRDRQARDCDSADPDFCATDDVYSLAKAVLAVEAAGWDAGALPLPGGGTRDLVADLNENFTGTQYGSATFVNDDIFALLALRAGGWDGPEARDAADFVASNQNTDGGIGYTAGDGSSTDLTAAAIMAMAPRNRSGFVDPALDYLRDAQVQDGEGAACFGASPGDDANAASTAWAVQGLVAAGENPLDWSRGGAAPTDCLLRFQAASGGFANSLDDDQDRPNLGATIDAVPGLAWAPFGAVRGPFAPEVRAHDVTVGGDVALSAPGGFVARDGSATKKVRLAPEEPGTRTLRGFTWEPEPHPLRFEVDVHPPKPAAPTIQAPDAHPYTEPVPVRLSSAGPWAEDLVLGLPDGTTFAGANHSVDLPPGLHRLEAHAVNADGEAGPAASATVLVRNPPPEVQVEGPAEAGPDEAVTLRAEARDPDGGNVTLRWLGPDGTTLGQGPGLDLPAEPGSERTVVAEARDPAGGTARAEHTVAWQAPLDVAVEGPRRSEPGSVVLEADVGAADAGDVEVRWLRDGEVVDRGPTARLDLPAGNHTLRAAASGGNGTAEALHRIHVSSTDDPGASPEPEPSPAPSDPEPGAEAPEPGDDPEPASTAGAKAADEARGAPGSGVALALAAGMCAAGLRRRR